jgi:hypothetical protein
LITPNQMARGSPINQHILDSTGTIMAYKLAAGMLSGTANASKPWFRLRVGNIDATQTGPISLWLAEVERILMLIFQESNFYTAAAVAILDLVIFGTCVMIIYENHENVIECYNPCLGEFYLENSATLEANAMYREFTFTVNQVVEMFGIDNCSPAVQRLFDEGGASLTRELVVAHAIEPNDDGRDVGVPERFAWRECYWEWGGSASPQGGSSYMPGLLRKCGFWEQPFMAGRWDLVSNDAYGRSPGMDGYPDIRQLQQETKRLAQGIDKMVNPPLVADLQMKNQPASLIPGGITYVPGFAQSGRPGFASVYQFNPMVKEMGENMLMIRERIKSIFYIDILQIISQYQTRSNVTAAEIDARRAEGLLMLGPVFTRVNKEVFSKAIDRTFGIAARSGILPPAPREIQGQGINIRYMSMLEIAQNAAAAAAIERTFGFAGNLAGADPQVMDGLDFDYGLARYSSLLNDDPKLIRSPQELQQIRADRQKQAQQQQQAEIAEKLAQGAQTLSQTDVGGGRNALQAMTGGA